MTQVEAARRAIADLETKLDGAKARSRQAEEAAVSVAFDAHVAGDDVARKALRKADADAAAAEADKRSLTAALGEAQRRLKAAESAETTQRCHDRARRAGDILPSFRARGARLDAILKQLNDEIVAMREDVFAFSALGVRMPSTMLVDSAARRGIQAALIGTGYDLGPLPPSERHSFGEIIEGWATRPEQFIADVLGDKQEAA